LTKKNKFVILKGFLKEGGDLASTGIVGAMCMSEWVTPLSNPNKIDANNTDYRPAYAAA